MTAIQFVGYTLINTTAITAITTADRITSGVRSKTASGLAIPSINYSKLAGDRFGLKNIVVAINCRAATEVDAENLQSLVTDTFVGSDGRGKYADVTGFSAYRISLVKEHSTIPETEGTVTIYNSPVDIMIVY